MKLFIDCEWTDENGELISMALVPEDASIKNFYEVLEFSVHICHPWVRENVVPIINKEPISKSLFEQRLTAFLCQFSDITIIADWPEDIAWFCRSLITGPGLRIVCPPLKMEICNISGNSLQPHNALWDALANRDAYEEKYGKQP